jgi:hypothetical protein
MWEDEKSYPVFAKYRRLRTRSETKGCLKWWCRRLPPLTIAGGIYLLAGARWIAFQDSVFRTAAVSSDVVTGR